MRVQRIRGTVIEDTPAYLMARVYTLAGSLVTQAVVSSIAYKVFDTCSATPSTATHTGSLTVSSVIFDTLQTGTRWTADSTGFNFGSAGLAAWWPTGDRTYELEITLTPTSGEPFALLYELYALPVRGS